MVAGGWSDDRLASHVLLDARIRYERPLGSVMSVYLYVDGRNLLDTNYVSGSFEPRPGRQVVLGMGARL
jgi:outer membrane receptor protein involved in Fe transport